MNLFALVGVFSVFFALSSDRVASETVSKNEPNLAATPPRGWNSYDSFCWVVSEEEFLQNAELVSKRLLPHGYEYVVVDYLWYRRNVPGAYVDSFGFDVIDEWGRVIPDPDRWPSSKGGKGFSEVAWKVHAMGLKFGIHIMGGISTQAYYANTPILDPRKGTAYEEGGRIWRAKDIGIKERTCAWMPHGFMSVNTSLGAGRTFLRSLHMQYARWGIDFVKHDCVFGADFDVEEIRVVSEVLRYLHRPIVYSLSPGTSVTPAMAKQVNKLVSMYRITADDWDNWGDVVSHFEISRNFATSSMIGAEGLHGRSWPDLDMLPLGWLTDPGVNQGPHRWTNLTLDEQKTQMTLWAMAKSPLMFGGDVRKLDDATYNLITNPTVLEINSFSSNNKEFIFIKGTRDSEEKSETFARQSHLRKSHPLQTNYLSLDSCEESTSKGWYADFQDKDNDRVCWKQDLGIHSPPFCLYQSNPRLASDEELSYEQMYQGAIHLHPGTTTSICLDASPRQKLTSLEFKRGSSSLCKPHTNHMWTLNDDGTLKSSYSGLCATMKTSEENAASPEGVRSWVATGRRGEIYVALFNLNEQKTMISARLLDLEKALPGHKLVGGSCKCREAWSGQDCSISTQSSISMDVEVHGAALIELNCG